MKINSETQRELANRLQFYRELGIQDFYRREQRANGVSVLSTDESPFVSECFAAPLVQPDALDREQALRVIREDLGECTRCRLHKGRKQIVFGTGNPNAELMFVGEAPGADEDEQGLPFVGRAGQLLTNMIKAMGLQREDVYIANIIKCRPPSNRTPERDECETCAPFLLRQINAIQPKAIVALGSVAARTLLGLNEPMANLRGQWFDFRGVPLAVTYHPAYLLRDPRQKKEAWKDLQMVMKQLGLPAVSGKRE
jgi:uracil-DNA glycosylase family 4